MRPTLQQLCPILALTAAAACATSGARAPGLPSANDVASDCVPATGDASSLLHRAAEVTGLTAAAGSVLHTEGYDVVSFDFQSDRPYPPYLSAVSSFESWFEPRTGVERMHSRTFAAGYALGDETTLGDASAAFAVRDTLLMPSTEVHTALDENRPLTVWAMLDDWLAASDVRVVERCTYRDFPRTVLARNGLHGLERLYVDAKTGFPVKVERMEPHYLWGQVKVEFLYVTWQRWGRATLPATYRLVEGEKQVERVTGPTRLMPVDSAPRLALPHAAPMGFALPAFLEPSPPDTVRVGPRTFLLRNRGYAETVMLARDTVFVFDATQSELRARQDSAWIGRLFPGRHPVVVVVTDLAWPHVGGVRYWVAQGATIVSHVSSKDFLAKVVERRWTSAPDLLESRRANARLVFRPVTDSLRLAGGDILVFGLGGIGSENAVAAFARDGAFLWASDYIQTLSRPTAYLDEVYAAVQRLGLSPRLVAAQHLALAPWESAAKLATQSAGTTNGRR